MNTEEARQYLISTDYPESQIVKAEEEDADCLNCEVGDWICISSFEGESDAITAIELAEDHKRSVDPKETERYLDFMMNQENTAP
jgi:hypothetical protein